MGQKTIILKLKMDKNLISLTGIDVSCLCGRVRCTFLVIKN